MMKFSKIRLGGLVLAVTFLMSGCASSDGKILMTIGENDLAMSEAKVIAAAEKRLISDSYGLDSLDVELGDGEFEFYVKDAIAEDIQRTFTLSCLAESEGMSISETEKEEILAAANEYLDAMEEGEQKALGISAEDVQNAMEDYILARRYSDSFRNINGVNADHENARVIRGKEIVIHYQNESDKAEAKNTMNKIVELRQNGRSFTSLAAHYSQSEEINVQFSRGTYEDSDYEDAVFALEEGTCSEVLERTSDQAFVLFYCLDSDVEELTAANEEAQVEEQINDLIENGLEKFLESHENFWNSSVWNSLSVAGDDCDTSIDFYEYCDKFLS